MNLRSFDHISADLVETRILSANKLFALLFDLSIELLLLFGVQRILAENEILFLFADHLSFRRLVGQVLGNCLLLLWRRLFVDRFLGALGHGPASPLPRHKVLVFHDFECEFS